MIKQISPFLIAGFILSISGCVEEQSIQADLCLDNPDKTAPGVCGCDVLDVDLDQDGKLDCLESCPEDPNKTEPGTSGLSSSIFS